MSSLLTKLKNELRDDLVSPKQVQPPPGSPTGHKELDEYLIWKGIPQGALSLFSGKPGSGVTSLWSQSASLLLKQRRWVAWMGDPQLQPCPLFLRRNKIPLSNLVYVETPKETKKFLWALTELMSLSLFDMIGCDLGSHQLRESQLIQLKKLARQHKVTLVFLNLNASVRISPSYSLALDFSPNALRIERALQRPTPHSMERRSIYEDTMSQLTNVRKALCS